MRSEKLHASNDKIQITYQGYSFRPFDEGSTVTVKYSVDEALFKEGIVEAEYVLTIHSISGDLSINDNDPSLAMRAKINSELGGWNVKCTRINTVSGMIFPHEVEINIDDKTILVRFDVLN